MKANRLAVSAALLSTMVVAQRTTYSLNPNWKFQLNSGGPTPQCQNPNNTFPQDFTNQQCPGLTQIPYANSAQDCENACCADDKCGVWQWCDAGGQCTPTNSCWTGALTTCDAQTGWVSRGRSTLPPPPPQGNTSCTSPWCQPSTDDSAWMGVTLPDDFVVRGNFTSTAVKSSGYLPYGIGYYRKHFTLDASLASIQTILLQFDGVQCESEVFINGYYVGASSFGFTAGQYFLINSWLNYGNGQDNILAVKADATNPDGWWYIGGGINRNAWLSFVATPGPFLAPFGVYAANNVTGAITWTAAGTPQADSLVNPFIEVWNNATTDQQFSLSLTIVSVATGAVVGTVTGSGTVPASGNITWSPTTPVALPQADLWHPVYDPNVPALYILMTSMSVNSVIVDTNNVTFGIRATRWDNGTGFWINDVNMKILGAAQHEDFAGIGGAVPDHLQWYRTKRIKDMGVNGWRTAHNAPSPALLDATDANGILVWDENHRNGQDSQIPLLVKRDRNHPSVVIWSLCNEVLCDTTNGDWVTNALRLKGLIHELDPYGGRPVSANQNGWIGPNTPLDVQGFDYSTTSYDNWHKQAPWIPSGSSETSSAVSDRGEYANDPVGGHVQGYDNQFPGWGQSAEGAWGGVGESNGQGILTRPFIAHGFTWTAFDYKGEPTPYGWPDINSHFGIMDICGFPKDRFYWYQAHFPSFNAPPPGVAPPPSYSAVTLYIFPHWNWAPGQNVSIWCYANVDEVELFLNDVSLGKQSMVQYGHLEWDAIPWVAGSLHAIGYVNGAQVAESYVNTTGVQTTLRVSVKDNFGATLYAGCQDIGLVQVEVVDANGAVVPGASDNITWTISGPSGASILGTGNGDPACLTNDKDTTRPAYHGLGLVVIGGPDASAAAGSTIVVTASAPGLQSGSVTLQVAAPDDSVSSAWCHREPTL